MTQVLTLSNLSMFETSKEDRKIFAQSVMQAINDGDADPLKIHLQLKCTEDLIKAIKDQDGYSDALETEAVKHGKRFELFNAKFEVKGGVPSYDWSVCNDPILIELTAISESAKSELKERENFLKNIPASGATIVIEETGEAITVYPPAKAQKDIIAVTLK